MRSKSTASYRPEVDGLRAIAVIAVVLFHFNFGLTGGYVGVDVFFVISGYLITSILIREMSNETFSFLGFWERRVRRILPAAVTVVLCSLTAGYWLLLPKDYEELGKSAFFQLFGLSNFFFWKDTGYFSGAAEEKPLLHTWSLGVEEQFYFLLPVGLFFLRLYIMKGKIYVVRNVLIGSGIVSLTIGGI